MNNMNNIIIDKHKDYIFIKNFLDKNILDSYLNKEKCYKKNESKVGSMVNPEKKIRKDIFFPASDCGILDTVLFNEKKAMIKNYFNIDHSYRETYKLGIYHGNEQGFYKEHTDTQGNMEHRKLSMVICLSDKDDYEGGIFSFVTLNKNYKFDNGDAIFFRSNLLHKVSPVTYGVRKVLISFIWDEDGETLRKKKNPSVDNVRYLPRINITTTKTPITKTPITKTPITKTPITKINRYESFDTYDDKIISYSLWGDSEIYNYGVVENALTAGELLPEFKIYIYYNDTILPKILNILQQLINVCLIFVNNNDKSALNMFWRFKPCFYSKSIVFVRDADSLINKRDIFVIKDFINSKYDICSCKDAVPHFKYAFVGGAWGCKNGVLNKDKYIYYFNNYPIKQKNIRGIDQDFLIQIFYNNINNIQLYLPKNTNTENFIEKNIKYIIPNDHHICSFNYFTPKTRILLNENNIKLNSKRYYSFGNNNESFRNAFKLITLIPANSGPGNQIIGIKECLVLSKLLNRLCIIPPIREHYLKSNNIYYDFNDIYKLNMDNIVIDTVNNSIINNLSYKNVYTIHGKFLNKKLHHEKNLKSSYTEILLNKRNIKNISDLTELENIEDNILVIKHLFNNVAISNCSVNGCFSCKLNNNFNDIYRDICSKFDFSDTIKNIGNNFIKNNLKNNYIAVHIRLPDIFNNKTIHEFTNGEFDNNKIINIINLLNNKHKKPLFIASNNIKFLKNLNNNFINFNENEKYYSFIDQYICCKCECFYYLNLDNLRWDNKLHNRSTFTSFILDYRLYNK